MDFKPVITAAMLSVFAGISSAEITTMNIRAFVDGKSDIVIKGDKLWWHHTEFSAPGLWSGQNEPTYFNSDAWYPEWPNTGDNSFCDCDSSVYTLTAPLTEEEQTATLTINSARAEVTITQQPDATNDYTLIISFDDYWGGAEWYDISIEYERAPVVPKLHGCLAHTMASIAGASAVIYTATGFLESTQLDENGCYEFNEIEVQQGEDFDILIRGTFE